MGGSREPDDRTRRSIGSRDVTEWRSRGGKRLSTVHQRLADQTSARTATVVTVGVGAGIAVAATWMTTALYASVAGHDGFARIDRPMLHAAMRLRNPATESASAAIARTFGPVGMPALALAGGIAISLRARSVVPFEATVAAGLGSLLMTIGGKDVVRRHRPAHRDAIPPFEYSPSFPSGHTMNATTIAGVLAFLLMLEQQSRAAQVATATGAAAVATTVGFSRVLLGAHWFTDVATGWSAGAGWLALVVTAYRLRLTVAHPSA